MIDEIGFCAGCNALRPLVSAACPECGQDLAPAKPPYDLGITTTLEADRFQSSTPSPSGPRAEDDLLGKDLGGYRIESLAGYGGMARVYRARHLSLGRQCAVKALDPALAAKAPDYVDQFLAEARAAAALVHPNIVTVHNVVEAENRHLIELEWVEGNPLGRTLLHRSGSSPLAVCRIMVQVAAGLAAAHQRGVVHRDVKPSNVLLGRSGIAKLADFGLAKRIHSSSQTWMAGTPYFMAPELFAGDRATTQSDVYAAAVTFFYLLTGTLPFRAPSLRQVIALHSEAPVPDARLLRRELPDRAAEILSRGLAKKPGDRHRDAAELHAEIGALVGSLRQLDDLVTESLSGVDAQPERLDRDRFEVQVRLAGGRRQRVLIERVDSELTGDRLLRISSPCAPADPSYFRRALEVNGRVDHGALAIQSVDGRPYFVMRNSYPWATCDPDELRQSVLTIATEADQVEAVFHDEDRH